MLMLPLDLLISKIFGKLWSSRSLPRGRRSDLIFVTEINLFSVVSTKQARMRSVLCASTVLQPGEQSCLMMIRSIKSAFVVPVAVAIGHLLQTHNLQFYFIFMHTHRLKHGCQNVNEDAYAIWRRTQFRDTT